MTIQRAAYILAVELLQSGDKGRRADDTVEEAIRVATKDLSHEVIFGEAGESL